MTFVKNTWYVAANDFEFEEGLVSRKICGVLVVMYRTEGGELVAMQDRCPHRFVRLSLGSREGDTLRCGYHGLRFGPDGRCVEMPNDPDTSLAPCVRTFPVVERYGVAWLWMGDPEVADADTIPDFSFISSPSYAKARGHLRIEANYQAIADNLLDLSHVHYLHPEIDYGGQFVTFKNQVRIEGETVWSMLWRPDLRLDQARLESYGFEGKVIDGQGHSRWTPPGVMLVQTAWFERGTTAEEGVHTPSAHLITPETEFTSHYFWATGRNRDIDNEEQTKRSAVLTNRIFTTQDAPMIASQQEAMGASTDFLDHKPVILKADAAGVAARRILKRMIRAEAKAEDALMAAAE